MASLPPSSLAFNVHRREPELITPAKPTPREFKPLSDIDDQESLRFHIPVIQFYRYHPSMAGKDPVKIIREALAKTLVFYYPFAGRLREGSNRKLIVECTGEGILFIEADANVSLEEFGDLHPPFPCLEELIFDVPGSKGVLDCPLMLIQVTRLKCGGFIFALRCNHTMADGPGLVQFMSTIGEMVRGAEIPSIAPVWERHVLNARDPPKVTCTHHEYVQLDKEIIHAHDLVQRSFFFGPAEISALKNLVPNDLRSCSTFEILTACLWKCRTMSLQLDSNEEMRLLIISNARNKFNVLPKGYYGNGFVMPAAISTAGELSKNPLGYALELIRKAKAEVSEEYVKSVADLMVIKGRPPISLVNSYVVSDLTRLGLSEVDLGWGEPVFGGTAEAGIGEFRELVSFYVSYKNKKGENGIVVAIRLTARAMERFQKELAMMLEGKSFSGAESGKNKSRFII